MLFPLHRSEASARSRQQVEGESRRHSGQGGRSSEQARSRGQRSLSRVRVIAFETADSRDSSRSEDSLGVVKNRFHVDVEGFQIAAHLGQSAYRLDGTV